METYYQESGRAGQDGLPSECLLYFRPADASRQSSMVFYENSGLQNLYDIVRYCQSKRECRRSAFFRHFAEPIQDCNGMCDNCAFITEVEEVDACGPAKVIISMLQDTQKNNQRLTMLQLVEKMKVKNKESGSELKRDELEKLVIQLILDGVLKEKFSHTDYVANAYVTIGPLAEQVLLGKTIVKLEISSGEKSNNCSAKRRKTYSRLEFKLDELRKELSMVEKGIFPYSVLSAQQISFLSSHKPKSVEELEKIIGRLKTQKYGSRILDEITNYEYDEQLNGAKRHKANQGIGLVDIQTSEDEQE